MDILTPGFKGLMRAARFLRQPSTNDFYLGRYAAMLEAWARESRREIDSYRGENSHRDLASRSAHYGRLALLCFREYRRRQKLK